MKIYSIWKVEMNDIIEEKTLLRDDSDLDYLEEHWENFYEFDMDMGKKDFKEIFDEAIINLRYRNSMIEIISNKDIERYEDGVYIMIIVYDDGI